MKNVPSYLETAAIEGGDTKAELMLCHIEAIEAQTEVLERIAEALERIAEKIGNSWAEA